MPDPQRWECLRRRLLAGDRTAPAELYERLRRFRELETPSSVDFHHEVFLRVATLLEGGEVRRVRNLRAYCFTVARNLASARLEARQREGGRLPPVDPAGLAAPDGTEQQLTRRELREAICACLERLPRAESHVLRLCDYEGLSVHAVAARMKAQGCPRTPAAVASVLKRGRERLRAMLASRGIVPGPGRFWRFPRWLGGAALVSVLARFL